MRGPIRFAAMLVIAVCTITSARADAGAPVALAFKFVQGETLNYDVSFSGAGSLVGPDGRRSTVTLQGSLTLSQRVGQVQTDGSAALEMLLPQADISVGVAGKRARFLFSDGKLHWYTDGKEQTPPNPGTMKWPLFQTPVLVTLTPDGRVTAMSLADQQIMDMIRKSVPGFDGSLPGFTSAAALFPANPVKAGESWTRTEQLPVAMAPGVSATCTIRHTLESVMSGAGQDVAKISGHLETTMRAPSFALPGQQGVSLSIPQLRQTIASTEFFNTTTGRLVQGDYDISFSTKIDASAQGRSQSGGIEAKILASVLVR